MPEKWTVGDSVARTIGTSPCWQVSLVRPDGKVAIHIMPTAALEWRAAEYGIDPTDVDTLLDIILHEPHMPTVDDPQQGPRYADSGPDLWQADNTDTAREAHLARIKTCPVRIDVQGARGLDTIRNGHQPDPDRLRGMRETVDTNRWLKKYGDLPARPADPIEARIPGIPAASGPRGRN